MGITTLYSFFFLNLKKIIRQIKVWHNFSLFCEQHRPHDLRPPNLAFPVFETSLLAVPNVVYILGHVLSGPSMKHEWIKIDPFFIIICPKI